MAFCRFIANCKETPRVAFCAITISGISRSTSPAAPITPLRNLLDLYHAEHRRNSRRDPRFGTRRYGIQGLPCVSSCVPRRSRKTALETLDTFNLERNISPRWPKFIPSDTSRPNRCLFASSRQVILASQGLKHPTDCRRGMSPRPA